MSTLVQQQQPFLTTADLQAQVTSYQAVDYDDAIKRCSDWQNLNKEAKRHFLFQALIEGAKEGVSRKQVFLDLPDGFLAENTFYRWIKAAPEDQQKQFPTADAHGGARTLPQIAAKPPEEEPAAIAGSAIHPINCACPVCLEQRRVERTTRPVPTDEVLESRTAESTPEMPVPTSLDQTTFPDGSVVDNLEAAYEALDALQAANAHEESEKAAVDAPEPVSGVSRVEDLTTVQLVTELIKRRGEFPGDASGHVFDGLQYWEAKLKALPVEVNEDDLVENWL